MVVVSHLFLFLWKSFKGRCDSHESHLPLFRTIYFPIAPYEEIGNTDFLRPFNDSIWYACLEGCANYMFPIQEKTFYLHGYVSRLEVYFYLFILCMGQYYSLLQISQDISELQIGRCRVDCTYDFLERLLCKFCSNSTPILKSSVHSFWFSGTRFLLKAVRFSFIIVM